MTDLVERREIKPADPFSDMAERVERNGDDHFGGAAVIVAPDGKVISLLMVDDSKDQAQFWATIKTRVQLEMQAMSEVQRLGDAFGTRR